MTEPIRVLCVEDHGIVRDGLIALINLQADMRVVGSGRDGRDAIRLFPALRPDVTLMDLELPNLSGLDATRQICEMFPEARIIILTVHQGNEDIFRALRAGAIAYLFKDALSTELTDTIRQTHAGTYSLPRAIATRLRERETNRPLTSRELEVINLISSGMSNKEIASTLKISDETVHAHVKHIFAKFEVSDRMSAVNIAIKRGIVRRS